MTTYSQLLVNTGGGIINRQRQSERQDGATIAIGLGGTGASAVEVLKRKVYQELKPDDPDSPIPAYQNVKFLVIDSDDSKIRIGSTDPSDLDRNTEYFEIFTRDIWETFGSETILKAHKELDWLNYKNLAIADPPCNFGGIRQIGRYLLFNKSAALREKFQSMIIEALDGSSGDLTIHLFSGLTGQTGSGIFLDVCYIIRNVLRSMGLSDSARVCGYFFLPDVNLSVPEVYSSPLISSYLRVNGYCALQELDYMMDLGNNGDIFRQNYGTFEVVSAEKPVDLCCLISSADANGKMVSNGYDYAMNVATDFVLSFMSKVTLPPGMTAGSGDGGQTLAGYISNLDQAKNKLKKKHGAPNDYNILSAFNAAMPLSDIATYLGAKLFEKFEGIYNRTPLEKDLNDMVSKAQLSFENIMRQLTRGINSLREPILMPVAAGVSLSRAVTRADNWLANTRGQLEMNFVSLSEPLNGYQIPKNSSSLIGRTYKTLYDTYVIHADKGPFFAMRLLSGRDNPNLLQVIDRYILKNKQLLEAEHRQDEPLIRDFEDAFAKLQAANFINGNSRRLDCLNKLKSLYLHYEWIAQHETMDNLLTLYRRQVIELNNNFFKVLVTVLESLHETFKQNAAILTNSTMKKNSYIWHIMTINDVKDTLDNELKKLDAEHAFRDLIDRMFVKYPEWMSQDENKIVRLISDFILQEFDSATKRTISDYLKVKFGTTEPTALSNAIRTQIMETVLEGRSEPLFWKSPMIQMDEIAGTYTLSIPFDAAEIVKAANDFAAGKNDLSIRRTSLTDRLFMMRLYTGVPLYAYQGLQELEKAYEADRSVGRHLYECEEKDWNKMLPSPIPDSLMTTDYESQRIIDKNKALKEELQKAKDLGIVVSDMNCYVIRESADLDLDKYVEGFGPYEENGTVNESLLDTIISELKSLKTRLYTENYKEQRINARNANPADLDVVLKDNYLRYPLLNRKVEAELAKLDALDAKIAELQKALNAGRARNDSRKKFFNAILTGVLVMQPTKIVYTYEEFGMEYVEELQNNKMPYAKCPVYQAYLTYQEINPEVRDRIDEDTADKMDNMDAAICAVAGKVQERHTPDQMKLYMASVAGDDKRGEIEQFYQDFMKALQYHLMMYKN